MILAIYFILGITSTKQEMWYYNKCKIYIIFFETIKLDGMYFNNASCIN